MSKNLLKKLSAGLLSTGLAFASLAASASSAHAATSSTGGKVTIGVTMAAFDDVWLTYLRNAMKQYADKNPNIHLILEDASNDSSKQLSEVETFISQKVNAIIVNPVDPTTMQPILKAANDAHIPLVAVNRQFPNQNLATSYVGSESIQGGILEMTAIAKLLHGKGNIAVVEGQLGQEAEVDRTKGYYQVLKKYPNIHVVLQGTGSWDRAKGMALMENWLHSGKHIDAVVSNNDEMAIGAIRAIDAAGLKGKIFVGGIDATPQGLAYVKSGELNVSVYQSALGQGQNSVKMAYQVGLGKKVPKTVWVPYELVLPKDASKYMQVWNSLTH